jgi:hypothetical protein
LFRNISKTSRTKIKLKQFQENYEKDIQTLETLNNYNVKITPDNIHQFSENIQSLQSNPAIHQEIVAHRDLLQEYEKHKNENFEDVRKELWDNLPRENRPGYRAIFNKSTTVEMLLNGLHDVNENSLHDRVLQKLKSEANYVEDSKQYLNPTNLDNLSPWLDHDPNIHYLDLEPYPLPNWYPSKLYPGSGIGHVKELNSCLLHYEELVSLF